MRRHRPLPVPALAVAGLLLLSGCSGDDARSLGPVPTAPTTTVSPTSTVPPTTAPVTTVRASTTTTAGPVIVDGIPQVTATPARAAVGTRVRLEGTGFTDEMWKSRTPPLWLVGGGGCNFYAQATHSLTVSAAGRLTGEFTVPDAGGCRMSDLTRPVTSGVYRIAFVSTPAFIGGLEVTTTAGPCVNVSFTPNTDDVAGNIIASGMDCIEAEALVRRVGPQVGGAGGPARLEVDGFVCIRTAQSGPNDRGLPFSEFECTKGSKKVTFRR